MPTLNRNDVHDHVSLLPPLPEQQAIAVTLSDIDDLIRSQEKLIAKKKNIKLGAIQELLTGQKRLPGFSGEWVYAPLKNYIIDFIVPMRDKPKNLFGPIPWCRIEDFNGKYLFSSKSNQGVSLQTIANMNLKVYPINTLLVSCSAYLGRCAIVKKELVTNQTFIGLVPSNNIDVDYLFYSMQWEEENLNNLSSGTTISYLSREQFEEYILNFPTKSEQTAIAAVLSDMDSEIEALTKKLSKYRDIKQGMMQELLTGRIRLVNTPTQVAAGSVKTKNQSHTKEYDEAIVIAALVAAFGIESHPMTAFQRQKYTYLFHRHVNGVAEGYGKFAAGPYNSKSKYGGPQSIALKKKYVKEHTGNYKGFISGEKSHEALAYFQDWYGEEPLLWMEQFRYVKKDELELLTTVDMAISDLQNERREVTMVTVKSIIQGSEIWKDKLKRPIFSDKNITRTIEWSNRLFGNR